MRPARQLAQRRVIEMRQDRAHPCGMAQAVVRTRGTVQCTGVLLTCRSEQWNPCMQIEIVPCLSDNYAYLVKSGDACAVVDPSEAGAGAGRRWPGRAGS